MSVRSYVLSADRHIPLVRVRYFLGGQRLHSNPSTVSVFQRRLSGAKANVPATGSVGNTGWHTIGRGERGNESSLSNSAYSSCRSQRVETGRLSSGPCIYNTLRSGASCVQRHERRLSYRWRRRAADAVPSRQPGLGERLSSRRASMASFFFFFCTWFFRCVDRLSCLPGEAFPHLVGCYGTCRPARSFVSMCQLQQKQKQNGIIDEIGPASLVRLIGIGRNLSRPRMLFPTSETNERNFVFNNEEGKQNLKGEWRYTCVACGGATCFFKALVVGFRSSRDFLLRTAVSVTLGSPHRNNSKKIAADSSPFLCARFSLG